MIGILDMAMGNLRSVSNAIYSLGFDFQIITSKDNLNEITHLIVPGVGSYRKAMQHLTDSGLFAAVIEFSKSQRPVLGVCLGMQLLSTSGDEGGFTKGLNLIPGHVVRFNPLQTLTIPHVGWNSVIYKYNHPIFEGVKNEKDFYFVHSYHFVTRDEGDVLAETNSGQLFSSSVAHENVVGFQFHPEKSQNNGLKLLENFCNWDGRC